MSETLPISPIKSSASASNDIFGVLTRMNIDTGRNRDVLEKIKKFGNIYGSAGFVIDEITSGLSALIRIGPNVKMSFP